MKLAIADPPYLGRADRWYGEGRGSGRERTAGGYVGSAHRPMRKPDHHAEAARWDDPAAHVELVKRLSAEYDGWAVAGHASSTGLLIAAAPAGAQLAIWGRPNAVPGGARVVNSWEPVVLCVPPARRDRATGLRVRDILVAPVRRQGFLGSKPPEWTRWVLEMLGYDPTSDQVDDLFPGSGSVAAAADGMLSFAKNGECS
ncbi:hypothetical protein [Microbacterium oleivorans]|uniref:DNA methylase n=1 Tax=Microbacterium oleivorans TaxID=273677 RepID=A0A7D5IW91_9MICO|nr:hypothetical protein [Microbacterium oleivorans]QLD10916.1 hypothetical protein HW566_03410 [Microbacterium oleivorans]